MYEDLSAEFYDRSIGKTYADNEELSFYTSLLNISGIYLEAMSGSGRLLIPLIKAGLRVHGVDNSASMLQSCKNRACGSELNLKLFNDSVETMKLPDLYNGIIVALGSFQLLPTRLSALNTLKNFKKHLLAHGKIIMDLFVPWDALYEEGGKEICTEREIKISEHESIKLIAYEKANKFTQSVDSHFIYQKISNGKIIETEEEKFTLHWYYQYEMGLMLERCGFNSIQVIERECNRKKYITFVAQNPL